MRAWIEERILLVVVSHVFVVFGVAVSDPSSCWVLYDKDLGHPALVQRRLNSCCSWVLIVYKMRKRLQARELQGGSLVDRGGLGNPLARAALVACVAFRQFYFAQP